MPDAEQTILAASRPGTFERSSALMRAGKVVGCPVDDSLLLVIGTGGPTAAEPTAELNDDPETQGAATMLTWPLAAPLASDTHGFAALLPTNAVRQRSLTTIRFQNGTQDRRYVFAPRPASVDDAAAIIADLAGDQLPEALDSLADVLMRAPIGRRRLSAITALLQAGARTGGCIELLGETDEGEIFIQGWQRDLTPGVCRVFVSGPTASVAECAVAVFAREDVPKDASGFVGLLLANEALEAGNIEGLLFQRRCGGWRYIPVEDRRVIVGPLQTPGLVLSVLLNTRSSPEVLLRLRSAANRFDGSETVSSLPLPVRMGIDNAFHLEDGGFAISGWLLDPDRHVETVKLRCHDFQSRIDDRWTRIDRPDVTSAFKQQPPFAGALDPVHHAHGFIVFADGPAGAFPASLHVELTLRDTRRAFMPLTPTRISARSAAMRQIRSIDPADWALPEIIERQTIPLLCASERSSPAVAKVVDVGPFDDATSPAIIVGLTECEEQDLAPLLALLALDPETRQAPIALVVPEHRMQRLAARLGRLAEFYGLSLRLVAADGAADVYDLFEAGARAVNCETVVLLAASLVPGEAGWYGKLLAVHGKTKDSIVSPTLAYEDHSVRWAGSWIAAAGSDRPLSSRYAGYPVNTVAGLKLMPVAAASLDCCVLPREALFLVGGFSRAYLGSQEKGLDLGLKLSRAGLRAYWLPSVQMLGSDNMADVGNAATVALVERIDRRIFDARWAPILAGDEARSAQVSTR